MEGADEGYRAIGRWIVQFSRLVGGMRQNMENRLQRPDDGNVPMSLVFGAAHAGEISNAFFAICRQVGSLDAAELNIAAQLQNEVDAAITERNKIAHGDWIIGRSNSDETVETYLVRVYPNRRRPPFHEIKTLNSKDFDELSDRLGVLASLVWPFGQLALGVPALKATGSLSKPGEYRVRDVLVAKNVPKTEKGGRVERDGPRASEIIG